MLIDYCRMYTHAQQHGRPVSAGLVSGRNQLKISLGCRRPEPCVGYVGIVLKIRPDCSGMFVFKAYGPCLCKRDAHSNGQLGDGLSTAGNLLSLGQHAHVGLQLVILSILHQLLVSGAATQQRHCVHRADLGHSLCICHLNGKAAYAGGLRLLGFSSEPCGHLPLSAMVGKKRIGRRPKLCQ